VCFVYRFNLGLEFVLFLPLSLSLSTRRSVDPHFLLVCTKLKRKNKGEKRTNTRPCLSSFKSFHLNDKQH
jgi:hypothetical protein